MNGIAFFFPRRGRALLALLLALLTAAAGTLLLGVSGWFISAAALAGATGGAAFNLFVPSAAVRGLSMLRIGSRYGERLAGHDALLRQLSEHRVWLMARLFPRLPLDRTSPRHGDVVSRLTSDLDALGVVLPSILGPALAGLAMGVAMTASLLLAMPTAALPFAAVYTLALVGLPLLLIRRAKTAGAGLADTAADLRMQVYDATAGHADLLALGADGLARRRFKVASAQMARLRRKADRSAALGGGTSQLMAGIGLLVVLWPGLAALDQGQMGGPLLVGLLLATLASFEAPAALMRGLPAFGRAMAAARRLSALAESPVTIIEPSCPASLPSGFDLELQNIGLVRDGRTVLHDISLNIPEGASIALTGSSGAGKTTLLQLLLRLTDPDKGSIRLGNIDLRDLSLADLHSCVVCLEQAAPIFLDTIRNNLCIARPEASEPELWHALEAARIADWVRSQPQGLDLILGETGATLSSGQRRRMCLARVLLSRAPILLLDEPTSGLDRDTELEFLHDLPAITAGRTVILVTHTDLPSGLMARHLRLTDGRLEEADVR